jgi:zinc/manganese transport system ATP-binding protein
VAVLHDLELTRDGFPQTLLLAGAPVAWGATPAVLTEANLRRAGMLLRVPRLAA